MDRYIKTLKEEIERYLETKDKVQPIVNAIYNKHKSLEDIKDIDRIEKDIIEIKIKCLEDKDNYLKKKSLFEAAVKNYMEEKLSGKKTSIKKIAEFYKINPSTLHIQIQRRYHLGEKYQYDRILRTNNVLFSYQQEVSLLESSKLSLMLEFTSTGQACICKTCFLLKLSKSAYEFAVSNNKKCPVDWMIAKQANIIWLKKFEMRHSCEISIFCSEICMA